MFVFAFFKNCIFNIVYIRNVTFLFFNGGTRHSNRVVPYVRVLIFEESLREF